MANAPEPSVIHKCLLDIFLGYTHVKTSGNECFFKHPTVVQAIGFDVSFQQSIDRAKKRGIKSEQQLVEEAIKTKAWSKQKEEEIKSTRWMVSKLVAALAKISDPLQRGATDRQIQSHTEKLDALEKERAAITKWSAESYASNRKWQDMVQTYCYKDVEFTEFVEDAPLDLMVAVMKEMASLASQRHMIYASYAPEFFDLYCLFSQNPESIFGVCAKDVTIYQKSLLQYASRLLHKFKNYQIPESLYSDPEKILMFTQEQTTGKTTDGIKDLKKKAAARGGNLTPKDYLT